MQEISFILGQKGMALYEGCYLILALFMFLRLHLPSFCKLVQLTCFPNLAFVEMKKSVIVFIYLTLFFSENLCGTFFFFLICSHCSEQVIRKIIQNMYLYFNNIVFHHSCSHMSVGDIMNVSAILGPIWL